MGKQYSVAYAYVTPNTSPDDVEFYKSRLYSLEDVERYINRVTEKAKVAGIMLLEFLVYEGDEIVRRFDA